MRKLSTAAFLAALSSSLFAAPLTPGNLLVVQVGDDGLTTAVTNAGTAVYLKEYTPSGTLVQTIAVPNTGTDKLVMSGTATAEGNLQVGDAYFTFGGYDATAGTATIAGTTVAAVNRMVGMVDASGTVTFQRITDGFDAGAIRSALRLGNDIFMAGNGSGVAPAHTGGLRYIAAGDVATTPLTDSPTNIRTVQAFGGQLYFTSSSGTFKGISSIGTGIPTTSGQLSTLLVTDATYAATNPPYDFAFDGPNTVYLCDERTSPAGGVQKWTFDGTNWNLAYTLTGGLAGTQGARHLAIRKNALLQNEIYVTNTGTTTSNARIHTTTDTGSGLDTFTQVVTSDDATMGVRPAFRGIRFIPAFSAVKTISGTVDLGDFWQGTWSSGPNFPITFNVYEVGGTTPLQTVTVNVNGSSQIANYSFNLLGSITSANLEIRAESPTHLRKRNATAVGVSGATVNFSLINGNCAPTVDGDAITTDDYLVLSNAFDTAFGDAGFDPQADLDKNDAVTTDDYLVLSGNFDIAAED